MMNVYTSFLFIALIVVSYSAISEVSLGNFDGSLHFVQVYEDGCSGCKTEQKELEEVYKVLEGIVKVGKINLKKIPAMKGQKLPKNPSYFFIKGAISDFVEYKNEVTRSSIVVFVLGQIKQTVRQREQKLYKINDSGSGKGKKSYREGQSSHHKDTSNVIELADSNFDESVLKSDDAWFVLFYSPSCGHCQKLQPQWDKLPSKIGKRVKIAKIDATVNRQMAQKFKIKGFPTILFFGADEKQTATPYESQRTAEAMLSWLQTQKIGQQKLQFQKLTKESYSRQCNRNIVCLIFILSKKSQLQGINFIEQILQQSKGKPLRFFYSSRLLKFEQDLMIDDRATPKLVSVWDSLNSYKIYNSEISKNNLKEFIAKIMERKFWIKYTQKIQGVLFPVETYNSQL